jgi:hypothetical protein
MRILAVVIGAVMVGLLLAGVTSNLLEWALRSPAAQLCLDTGGRRLGDQPMPEALARMAAEECREEMQRRAVVARYENAHSWPVILLTRAVAVLLDPIRIALFALYGAGAYFTLRRILRRPAS